MKPTPEHYLGAPKLGVPELITVRGVVGAPVDAFLPPPRAAKAAPPATAPPTIAKRAIFFDEIPGHLWPCEVPSHATQDRKHSGDYSEHCSDVGLWGP